MVSVEGTPERWQAPGVPLSVAPCRTGTTAGTGLAAMIAAQ